MTGIDLFGDTPEEVHVARCRREAFAMAGSRIDFWVPGKPRGKDRPRFDSRTKRTYSTKETENAEAQIVQAWRDVGEPRQPNDDDALWMRLTIVMERPGSHFNTKGELNAAGRRQPYPATRKPDIDNALKLVMDALNGRAYKDDVRFVDTHERKAWGDRAGMRILIGPMHEPIPTDESETP